jgi:copper chaperone CopZ
MKKIILRISGMHCVSCALNIDGELEDTKGVKQSRTNYAKQTTEVEFDEMLINEEKITSIIKGLGYTCATKD